MYEEMVNNIYDAVCNNDSTPSIEAKVKELWEDFENDPTQDNAMAACEMYEIRGFFLGFEAAKTLLLQIIIKDLAGTMQYVPATLS